jgi:hypothetical protein
VTLNDHADRWLLLFLCGLLALNAWRLDTWTLEALRVYLTHPIMQTTLYDFACVLAILVAFIHEDARRNGLTYWWIVPTFPFMPTVGLLLYFIVRKASLSRRRGAM